MTSNESWRRYLDAGAMVGQVTLARAEEIAKGLFAPEKEERDRAWRDLDVLGRAGRQIGGQLFDLARREVVRQAKAFGSVEDLVDLVADVVGQNPRAPEPDAEAFRPEPRNGPQGGTIPVIETSDSAIQNHETGDTDSGSNSKKAESKKAESKKAESKKAESKRNKSKKAESKKVKPKKRGSQPKTKASTDNNATKKAKSKQHQADKPHTDSESHQRSEHSVAPGATNRVLTLAKPLDLP